MAKRNSHGKRSLSRNLVLAVLFCSLLLITVGGVLAKYVQSSEGKNLVSAKEFYFTSDLLGEPLKEYVLNATSFEVTFTLGNCADKLRFSQDNIRYSVSVTCEDPKEGDPLPALSQETGVLEKDKASYAKVTLQNLVRGRTYLVTAVGIAGYEQTLQARFTVSDNDENVFMHVDSADNSVVILTVWTENVKGNLSVGYTSEGLIPDNTHPILRNIVNYRDGKYTSFDFSDTLHFTVPYASATYRFFLSTGSVVDGSCFYATIVNGDKTYIGELANLPS